MSRQNIREGMYLSRVDRVEETLKEYCEKFQIDPEGSWKDTAHRILDEYDPYGTENIKDIVEQWVKDYFPENFTSKSSHSKSFNTVVQLVKDYCDEFNVKPEDGYEAAADYILQYYEGEDLQKDVRKWFEDTYANYPETLIPLRESRRKSSQRYREEIISSSATNNGEELPENFLGGRSRKERESTNWRNDLKAQFAEPGVYSGEGKPINLFETEGTEEKIKKKVKKLKEALSISVLSKVLKEDDQFEINRWKMIPLILSDRIDLKIRKEMEGRTILFGLRADERKKKVDAYIGPLCFKQNILPRVGKLSVKESAKLIKELMAEIQNNFDEFLSTYYKDITKVLVDYALEDFESRVH